MPILAAALFAAFALVANSAAADTFRAINDRDMFVGVIKDRELKRLGISLRVSPAGQIAGRAFGTPVTGRWQWSKDGYFCRDLYYGEEALGPNCQLVEVKGSTIRFTSDKGEGQFADLRLR